MMWRTDEINMKKWEFRRRGSKNIDSSFTPDFTTSEGDGSKGKKVVYARLAMLMAGKKQQPRSSIMASRRCRLFPLLLRSARGTRSLQT